VLRSCSIAGFAVLLFLDFAVLRTIAGFCVLRFAVLRVLQILFLDFAVLRSCGILQCCVLQSCGFYKYYS
jgi:hypothetical protein